MWWFRRYLQGKTASITKREEKTAEVRYDVKNKMTELLVGSFKASDNFTKSVGNLNSS
jgi:hypothetical protein